MEALNLLKFWRNSAGETVPVGDVFSDVDYVNTDYQKGAFVHDVRCPPLDTTTTTTTTDDDSDDDDSFFDLQLTAPARRDMDLNASKISVQSPRDVFRAGKVFPFDSNLSKPQSPIPILRSAPKFKVFLLGFKKSNAEINGVSPASPKKESRKSSDIGQSNRFSVNRTVEEVPGISRDNSLRSKLLRESFEELSVNDSSRKSEKEVPKYLKLIKPLYSMASKKYNAEKVRFPDKSSAVLPMSSPATVPTSSPRKLPEEKQGNNRASGFKVVYKHIGKSRSAASAVGMTPSPVHRRDDLLLQNDAIQGAILHCKRSYSSTTEVLSRCSSDQSDEKSMIRPRVSIEEMKRCSI